MLFHTWHFALFFFAVYALYLPLRRTRYYVHWLLAASYVFYGWWNPLYLLLITSSILVCYYAVVLMDRTGHRRLWLTASIVGNLGVLGYFKYGGFLAANASAVLDRIGLSAVIPVPEVLLPVGISFYTFQSLSYVIDYSRGRIDREPSLVRFGAFVSLFPQLVAGPIERARNLLPQLTGKPQIRAADVADGLSLFVVGLFKKLVLADYLGLYVDEVYAAPGAHDGVALATATFAFGWQIYFDFSGYTDMARGVARAMGFELMVNFNRPYLATSLGDFWQRWHIGLSTWFKEYVYIPLGGNRHGTWITYRNMFLTMVVSGLWHGAAWNFVIWGALHAAGRFLTRELEATRLYRERVPTLVKQVAVFVFVTFCWVFFRAEGLADAVLIVRRMVTADWADPRFPLLALTLCLSVWAYQLIQESRARRWLECAPVRVAAALMMIASIATFATSSHEPFIYFQF